MPLEDFRDASVLSSCCFHLDPGCLAGFSECFGLDWALYQNITMGSFLNWGMMNV